MLIQVRRQILVIFYYRLPDHPALLQEWIEHVQDVIPDIPVIRRRVQNWNRVMEGKLDQVWLEAAGGRMQQFNMGSEFTLN